MRSGLAALALTALLTSSAIGAGAHVVIPHLEFAANDGAITIEAGASGPEGVTVTGRLSVSRVGVGGTSQTTQSATMTLTAGELVQFAELGLSLAAGDRLEVVLTIEADGSVVAEAMTTIGP